MNRFRKAWRHPVVGSAVISLLTLGILLGLRAYGLLQRPELIFYDAFVRERAEAAATADQRIVICGMTTDDLIKYGHPLDDQKLSALLENIAAAEPCVIGLDLYRDLPEPRSGEYYPKLEATFKKLDSLIAIERVDVIPPPPAVPPDRVAPNNLPFDVQFDGVCRRAYLFLETGLREPRESFALALAHTYLVAHQSEVSIVDHPGDATPLLRLGRTIFPRFTSNAGAYSDVDVGDYEILVDYLSPKEYRNISFEEVLENRVPAKVFKDAIVIIGVLTESVKDSNPTPVDSHLRGTVHHAMIVNQLLRSALDGVPPTGWWSEPAKIAWIGLFTLLGGVLGLGLRSPWRLAPALALVLASVYFAGKEALSYGLWIPVTTPAMGAVAAATFVTSFVVFLERADRRVMHDLFSRHVSKEVLDVLWSSRDELFEGGRLKPHLVTATVLFTDLKDFSTLSEDMDPADLMSWNNEYMSRIVPHVESRNGIVNSYRGDGIMAVFGAPFPRTTEEEMDQDACHAVECALAMRQALKDLNAAGGTQRGMNEVEMRVGIYTGLVVTGSLGSTQRLEYGVLGDTTNTAARLESLGRELEDDERTAPCTILIGDSTFQRLHNRFTTKCLGPKRLKGKAHEVIVHSVLSVAPQPSLP